MKKHLFLLAAFLFCRSTLYGQEGGISGTVTDPSGAVVPGAEVTVTDAGTGQSRSAITNPQGHYVIPALRPGDYSLRVDAPGFRKYSQSGIVLRADQRVTVNVALLVGETEATVTVDAGAQQVDTQTSTLTQVVDERRMVDLPLNGRNAAKLTLLVAGAVSAPDGGADTGSTKTFPGAVTISTNGSRQNQISYTLDGGSYMDTFTNVNQPFPFSRRASGILSTDEQLRRTVRKQCRRGRERHYQVRHQRLSRRPLCVPSQQGIECPQFLPERTRPAETNPVRRYPGRPYRTQ
jgi:Carboxypeptidase regulatory-like domain